MLVNISSFTRTFVAILRISYGSHPVNPINQGLQRPMVKSVEFPPSSIIYSSCVLYHVDLRISRLLVICHNLNRFPYSLPNPYTFFPFFPQPLIPLDSYVSPAEVGEKDSQFCMITVNLFICRCVFCHTLIPFCGLVMYNPTPLPIQLLEGFS
ncbi:unnamed protein product [Ilex paraguariensis]|uniref:Uncharacterized protein n=1 Tax=Ilex paraguariensis TaxID=185542 RepID=A0ABC8SM03_9AQUA